VVCSGRNWPHWSKGQWLATPSERRSQAAETNRNSNWAPVSSSGANPTSSTLVEPRRVRGADADAGRVDQGPERRADDRVDQAPGGEEGLPFKEGVPLKLAGRAAAARILSMTERHRPGERGGPDA
jgi:hypothetical protein